MKDVQNEKIEYDRSYSLHGLLNIRVKGDKIVTKTTDAEFENTKNDRNSKKNHFITFHNIEKTFSKIDNLLQEFKFSTFESHLRNF